jgi:hypothetical protein
MKTITIAVQDEVYAVAEAAARRTRKPLAEYLRDLLTGWSGGMKERGLEGAVVPGRREQWLRHLREVRATHGAQTGRGPATQEILDDLRAERL